MNKATVYLVVVAVLGLGQTGCQQPATAADLKKVVEGSSFGKVEHFTITKGSLSDVRARLGEYAERCLSREMIAVQCGLNCTRSKYATYHPHFENRKEGLRFVLQRKDEKGIEINKLNEKGMYVLVAEAEPAKGKIAGHIWGAKVGYGDIIGSTRGWMTGDDKKCPDIE